MAIRVALATEEDVRATGELVGILNGLLKGYFPCNDEGEDEFFDIDSWDDCHKALILLLDHFDTHESGIDRTIWLAQLMLDNNVVDKNSDVVELNPMLQWQKTADDADLQRK